MTDDFTFRWHKSKHGLDEGTSNEQNSFITVVTTGKTTVDSWRKAWTEGLHSSSWSCVGECLLSLYSLFSQCWGVQGLYKKELNKQNCVYGWKDTSWVGFECYDNEYNDNKQDKMAIWPICLYIKIIFLFYDHLLVSWLLLV